MHCHGNYHYYYYFDSTTEMFDEAENVLREAVRIMPDGSHFCYALGVLMGKTQRYQVCVNIGLRTHAYF